MLTFAQAKRPYIILTVIAAILFTAAILVSINVAKQNDKIFCELLEIHVQYPVPKPTNPTVDVKQEKAYRLQQGRIALIKQLGC